MNFHGVSLRNIAGQSLREISRRNVSAKKKRFLFFSAILFFFFFFSRKVCSAEKHKKELFLRLILFVFEALPRSQILHFFYENNTTFPNRQS